MSKLTKALRDLANFIDLFEDELGLPYIANIDAYYLAEDKERFVKFARVAGKTVKNFASNAAIEKIFSNTDYYKIKASMNGPRDLICTKIVKGYKDIREMIIPAHREEIVEWECGNILES